MRIGIDCSCVAKAERTGVARYCASLVDALPAVLGEDDRADLLYRISRFGRRAHVVVPEDARFRMRWFQDGPIPIRPRGLDVIHGPDLRIPKFRRVPCVSTVHDLSALELPGIADEKFRRTKERALADVARRAAVILCISDYTRDAFLRRFPEAAPRTRVVPLGLGAAFRPQTPEAVARVREANGLRSPYLLFVGQISARKNLMPLVRAFGAIHARRPGLDLDLVLAGPVQTGGQDVLAAAEGLPVASRVKRLGYVGDDELPALYAGAVAFCFTGKGEGFGLPVLEAMACGTPVVAARAAATEGTCGGAAVLVHPDSEEELAAAALRLVDGGERQAWIGRGHARAAQFDWKETARRTVEAYRDAARAGAGVPA
ncbi:MAG: D-inositol-3-phosphate glycosyltransferase [Planctomycetes bacterium]|nr:D-inositol-3-phosphate glycosyltransferase [Planctomycetota bacterium]